ncbi:hemerythrin domain-containing protein [Methylobacterium dankookense]|uniref:Hemerythrin-like domain-containing protein n=1 Tax=Methylobacterium dankookense TaxID=560405 RepID=A0A564FT54_9HYPH|nr:hemerythrin domain-containing protein [Methylobacterium dankookense]GJD55239.1 hypothetical protein IFDJLNFL_1123 [Methylobacterium dankookense]VUF11319.1 hypothetical protein MTDSW087_01000 [Methylobacterium dankookense]
MDLWQLIERDHENIAQLIREIPYALNGPGVVRSRERMLGDLMGELQLHAVGLDASLYAALAGEDRTQGLIGELHRSHAEFMRQLNGLSRYRQKGSTGWLDTFEDVTFLVDQHLHRHVHELIPAARSLLSPEEVNTATRTFIRAKTAALQGRQRVALGGVLSSETALIATLTAAATGIGLLAWHYGVFGRARSARRGSATESHAERRERQLDEAVEDTFPASDPISPGHFTK